MEELIQNFMLVTEGPQIPPGEVYFEAENPKGILGFFIVSKGGGVPWRLKIRSPSFCNLSIVPKICVGMPDVRRRGDPRLARFRHGRMRPMKLDSGHRVTSSEHENLSELRIDARPFTSLLRYSLLATFCSNESQA